jgi:hypothetical protein
MVYCFSTCSKYNFNKLSLSVIYRSMQRITCYILKISILFYFLLVVRFFTALREGKSPSTQEVYNRNAQITKY